MTHTTFIKEKLQGAIDSVWNNSHSFFYREFWKTTGIKNKPSVRTFADWSLIPFLTRTELQQVPDPSDRLHIPYSEVDTLYSTSGTSGKEPLFFWRSFNFHQDHHAILKAQNIRRAILINAYDKTTHTTVPLHRVGVPTVIGDPHNITNAVRLAKLTSVDALFTTPTLAFIFAEELKRQNYPVSIRVLFVWGEYCSDLIRENLAISYPHALIVFSYGQSEVGGTIATAANPCSHPNLLMHPHEETFFFEIIDEELIITTLEPLLATPLIRYRTGDSATLINQYCKCGKKGLLIKILGRINGDFIRAAGGEIRAEELDKTIAPFLPYIEPNYSLSIGERLDETGKISTLILSITKRQNISTSDDSLALQLIQSLMTDMRLSQNMRLKDAVAARLSDQPTVTFVPKPLITSKHKKLVRLF